MCHSIYIINACNDMVFELKFIRIFICTYIHILHLFLSLVDSLSIRRTHVKSKSYSYSRVKCKNLTIPTRIKCIATFNATTNFYVG